MCGSNHDHDHSTTGQPLPADTLTITIAPSGVIQIQTGQMLTSHATVGDAIAAFARAAGVSISQSARVVKGMVHDHNHATTTERTKAR